MLTRLNCHRPMLASRSGRLARCFLISTTQHAPSLGRFWRFTDAPMTVNVLEGDGSFYEYQPLVSIAADSRERVSGLSDRTTTLRVSTLDDASFTADDARLGLLESALVYEFVVDWLYPHQPPIQVFRWRVTQTFPQIDGVQLNLAGISSDLRKDVGDWIGPACRNEFGDALCDLGGSISASSAFRFRHYVIDASTTPTRNSFTIAEAADTFPAASLSAADWWSRGVMYFEDGDLAGHRAIIETNTQPSGTPPKFLAKLITATEITPSAGDLVAVRVGCDKKRSTCGAKFSNIDNLRAFDLQPGSDLQRKTPEAK